MFAFAHDFRIMRNDFGYMEMSESKLGMSLPPGMMATVKVKTGPSNEFRDLILLSRRFSPAELLALKWIDQSVDPDKIFDVSHKLAVSVSEFGKNKENYKKLKEEMNKTAIDGCFNK